VQLASIAFPTLQPAALVKDFIENPGRIVGLIAPLTRGGAAPSAPQDATRGSGGTSTPLTLQAVSDPATDGPVTSNATLAASTGEIGNIVTTVLAQLILAPIVFAFFGAILLIAAIQSFFNGADSCCASTLASETPLREVATTSLAQVEPEVTEPDLQKPSLTKHATGADQATPAGKKRATEADQATSSEEKRVKKTDQGASAKEDAATGADQASTEKKRTPNAKQAASDEKTAGAEEAAPSKQRGNGHQPKPSKRDDNDKASTHSAKRADSAAGEGSSS
jgi:hypothetical protein